MSIIIAFSGFFIAYMMYIKKAWNPGWWVTTFSGWYHWLQNKYFFDHFYVKIIIQKILLGMNNILAWLDMGIYDKYAIDGWASVNRFAYRVSNWFDNKVIDTIGVDGTGASVRLFNVVLRTVQSGKIQLYIMILVLVLASYIWTLI